MNRRQLLTALGLGGVSLSLEASGNGLNKGLRTIKKPIVVSTWYNQSTTANVAAWNILKKGGAALDAVEAGVMVSEDDWGNCCVGLGGNPDREGIVTLDACIMNHQHHIGSVAALERIKNPIQVARLVMEKTPHVMLVGQGAQQFALQNGFTLEDQKLSDHAQKAYTEWLKKSDYQPVKNIEKGHGPSVSEFIDEFEIIEEPAFNHDTIGMIALDDKGNLGGACTTSGLGFKMHGRVGDSPIIGAGLYVDNQVGAVTATGNGEEVIRICGSFLVVEFMRQGYSPSRACKKAVDRIKKVTPRKLGDIQIGFIAINTNGEFGSHALNDGFDFGVTYGDGETKKYDSAFG